MNQENKEIPSENAFETKASNLFLRHIFLIAIGMIISHFLINSNPIIINKSSKFDELLSLIQNHYVDSLDYSNIENKAVNNLLSLLDPHSVYIPKEELAQSNEPLVGNFDGIGVEFYIANDTLIVVSPITNGPSELAGIKSGDKIIKINDTIVAGVGIQNADVFKKLRGQKGTTVKLGIQRNNSNQLIQIVVKRNKVQVNSVEKPLMLDDKTGYIKINTFGEQTYNEFRNELEFLVKEKKIEHLVLDLRQNTGGYLEICVNILDELIDQNKLLVYTKGRNHPTEKYISKTKGLYENGKLSVIIDEGSASASEILAGAVQDLDRGVIIGRRSFGKGLVQSQINLKDGSAVRLTVAKYYTFSGRSIQKPYKNGNLDYEYDILKRYENGELFAMDSIKDVDTMKYFTINKRIVKGGGGIYPDVFVPIDTNFDLTNFSLLRSVMPDYVYSNQAKIESLSKNYNTFKDFNSSFQINSNWLQEFYKFAKKSNPKINLSRSASFENRVKYMLKAYVARMLYKTEGFYSIINQNDPAIQKALNANHQNLKLN